MWRELRSPLVRRVLGVTVLVAAVQLLVLVGLTATTVRGVQREHARQVVDHLDALGLLSPCRPERLGPLAAPASGVGRSWSAVLVETSAPPPCDQLSVRLLRDDPRAGVRWARLAAWVAAVLLLAALVAVPLVRRIRTLDAAAQAMAERDFEGALETSDDELGQLAHTLNQAARRARETIEELRRRRSLLRDRLADLAHDVRTPLASLKLGLGSSDPAVQRALRAEVEYLDRLFDNLASLALIEGDALPCEPVPLDLREVAEQLAMRFAVLARDADLSLRLEGTSSWVHADPVLLAQAVSNLVHNALKHAQREVVLRTARNRIEVLDDGPGFPAALLEAGPARRTSGRRGGLGLAIASALAEAQGMRLVLTERPGGGAVASLEGSAPAPGT